MSIVGRRMGNMPVEVLNLAEKRYVGLFFTKLHVSPVPEYDR